MDFRTKITVNLPEELILITGINNDTPFFTSYENGVITIEPLDEEDANNIDDVDDLIEDSYDEGFAKGTLSGYKDGYEKGYKDCSKDYPYNDKYRGQAWYLREADNDCSETCEDCEFYDSEHCSCALDD